MKYRKILHLDLDAFFCAVEEQLDASLEGRPFAVGGRPDRRGVVSSCSYAARLFGIRSAMPMARAVKLCPDLVVVHPHFQAYQDASEEVMARLGDLTPLVEQLSIDEAFLDVSDLPEPAEEIARSLQQTINSQLDLPCSLGVATNKLVAKIANNVGKAEVRTGRSPNTIKVVPAGQEAAFLAPLAVQELWGVGPKTAQQLIELGIHTIGDLARWSEDDLVLRFGKPGRDLSQRARAVDDRPVEGLHEAKSVSHEVTFVTDVKDGRLLRRTLRSLSEQVGRRLRRQSRQGTTIKIKLRWANFTTLTRQVTLDHATNLDGEIYAAARQLFEQTWTPGKYVRLIGVGVSGFESTAYQLGLWNGARQKEEERLLSTLDRLRERFGEDAVRRASELEREMQDEED